MLKVLPQVLFSLGFLLCKDFEARFAASGSQVRTPTPVQVIPSSLVSSLSQLTSSFVNGGGHCTMYSSKQDLPVAFSPVSSGDRHGFDLVR